MVSTNCSRGSEWRKWDLHIHSPASFHWKGERFKSNPQSVDNEAIVDEMIGALNAAEPAVFAIMDYWTFDGWFTFKHRLEQTGAPIIEKTVFPGIELRLVAPMAARLNAHVIFSDLVSDQILRDFKSELRIAIIDRPLSDAALIDLARAVGEDKLNYHGFNKPDVDSDAFIALNAGSTFAEITCESYRKAIENVPDGFAVGFMPFNTNDGLAQVKWQDHYAYCMGLFKSSPIFETRKHDNWAAFAGVKTPGNSAWIDSFQNALNNVPRLAVSGSDAHQFVGVAGDNDRRGYGGFPSGKITWIKADPTFRGLLHAVKEPAKRSYIGEIPAKIKQFKNNKNLFINKISVGKINSSAMKCEWLNETSIELNLDLVAVIGNKGSGKSALADITALLGNSKQKEHFTFLKRFRGRNGDPAKQFLGSIQWADNTLLSRNLNYDPQAENAELVKYIPQGHFEELCNAHVTGNSNAFERELRSVIFSHAGETVRLGALDFDQLIDQQESTLRGRLEQIRSDLRKVNRKISKIEEQMLPETKKALLEQLEIEKRLITEHNSNRPEEVTRPTEELSIEQRLAAEQLESISTKLKKIGLDRKTFSQEEQALVGKQKAIKNIHEKLQLIERQFREFEEDVKADADILGIDVKEIAALKQDKTIVDAQSISIADKLVEVKKKSEGTLDEESILIVQQKELNEKLDAPQRKYQKYAESLEEWKKKLEILIGDSESPDTLKGLETRINQIENLPSKRKLLQDERLSLTGEIFDSLDSQRLAREELFKPVQELISNNALIRNDHKLRFRAELSCTVEKIGNELFSLIKQNSGELRGESESINVLRLVVEKCDFSQRDSVLGFVTELHDKIESASKGSTRDKVGIESILRIDRKAHDVYDLLFSLSFLEPRYTLLFQDAHIEQLSPGQRGALLLIFYLLVDKGQNPIILDQPEENLDNETVVSLLVPVLNEAKEKRQIIMVTHNPNLAVVCDAEQIIHCEFDRKNQSKITYTSGSIENQFTNRKVIDVLEGTMPAFNNRSRKYTP